MKKLILKTLIFITLFIVFNINEIDSNSDKVLNYDKTDIHLEDTFKVYFKSLNSNELDNILKYVNVEVMNYIIDDKKYYARNNEILVNEYTKEMNQEKKALYKINGVKINALNVVCTVEELIKIEHDFNIY